MSVDVSPMNRERSRLIHTNEGWASGVIIPCYHGNVLHCPHFETVTFTGLHMTILQYFPSNILSYRFHVDSVIHTCMSTVQTQNGTRSQLPFLLYHSLIIILYYSTGAAYCYYLKYSVLSLFYSM